MGRRTNYGFEKKQRELRKKKKKEEKAERKRLAKEEEQALEAGEPVDENDEGADDSEPPLSAH